MLSLTIFLRLDWNLHFWSLQTSWSWQSRSRLHRNLVQLPRKVVVIVMVVIVIVRMMRKRFMIKMWG